MVLYSLPPPERRKRNSRPSTSTGTGTSTSAINSSGTSTRRPIQRGVEMTRTISTKTTTSHRLPPPPESSPEHDNQDNAPSEEQQQEEEEAEELRPSQATKTSFVLQLHHVAVFLISASALLFLLFYFAFYNAITVLYGIGCAGSVSHLIFAPIYTRIIPKLDTIRRQEEEDTPSHYWTQAFNNPIICGWNGYDILSQGTAYLWAAVWLWYGLSHYRPSQHFFFWITLDIFGASFCIIVLSMLKLNSIKIATVFLAAVFVYGT